MNPMHSASRAILFCTIILLCFTITSWKQGTPNATKTFNDTTPPKQEKKITNLDDALQELDGAHDDLEKSIKDIDWNKMDADINEATKNLDIDLKKANADLKKSLSEIDVEKMRADVEASVAKIDWDEIKRSIEKAKDIDFDKIKTDLEKTRVELAKQKPALEKQLREAHLSIEKAKENLREYKSFTDALEHDGLINKKQGYVIEHRNGQLLINGKQQPAEIYNKHRAFLDKNKTFTLKQSDGNFNLDNN